MLKEERQTLILEKLATDKKINFTDLSKFLNVSYDSIRRDIIELEDKGLLKKVHGGAVINSYLPYVSDAKKGLTSSDEINILFKKALTLFENHQTIIMDGGTTNFFMAQQLPKMLEATIVTNSPALAMVLNDHPSLEVILLGGSYFKRYQITLGSEVYHQLDHINADYYFIGINGIDPNEGLSIRNYEESLIKQKMMRSAKKTVCCVIEEKLHLQEAYKICDFSAVDYLITNLSPMDEALNGFQGKGVEII
ncbi:DeoR/GlpR family DNA-binding transcription regulator [Emticicia sp. C21]|uniref:DeoR/GlpR family DNA-binding transcription regulator n=1 Tax=Emticicia sp. C21 TaxID=2302915 RepID=UPI000E349799|nr:DeoR/GlpR family DNA-binding transcription regulator [Emticicia sp. C21]RFS15758.1 DeoR/GlpR transcriptional regulator [Emticicia sp. C21]